MGKRKWSNTSGGDFATSSNWKGHHAPTTGSSALLNKASGPITSAANETLSSLTVTGSVNSLVITAGAFTSTRLSNSSTIDVTGGSATFGGGGNNTINNKLIEANGGAVTFSNTIVRQSVGASITAIGAGSTVTLTSATIDGGTLSDSGGGLIQTGDSNSVLNGATLLYGAVTNTGSVRIRDNNALTLEGKIANSGTIQAGVTGHAGLFIGAPPVVLSGGGTVELTKLGYIAGVAAGATLTNLDNTIEGGGFIVGPLNLTNAASGVIDDKTGRMVLDTGNTVTNNGLVESTGTGALFVRFTTIDSSGGGSVVDGKQMWLDSSTLKGGSLTVNFGAFLKSRNGASTINLGGGTVANAGVIEATGGGLTIDGAVANNRVLETFNSNLTITGAVTGIGAAELLGKGGLEVDGAFAQRVTFVHGSTATLVLGDSAGFTGSVVGLSKTGANHIDLKDVAFDATDTAVYTPNRLAPARGGVLRILHGTTVLATVRLGLTDYTGQTFHLTNDGSGGTLITDPKTAALASHIASFAPGGGHSASPATAPAFTPHMLAMAHA